MLASYFFKVKALYKSTPRLKTRLVRNHREIRAFFDQVAEHYVEFHGKAGRLLKYRLGIVRRLLQGVKRGTLVEIGCGTGLHLFELNDDFDSLVGTDLSPNMIREAEKKRQLHPAKTRIRLSVDAAEKLSTLTNSCVDAVLCVGGAIVGSAAGAAIGAAIAIKEDRRYVYTSPPRPVPVSRKDWYQHHHETSRHCPPGLAKKGRC